MRPASFRIAAFLLLPGFAGCSCDDALNEQPRPAAVLAHEDTTTPPEPHLTVALPTTLVGTDASVTLEVRNQGKAVLQVTGLTLGRDETLCPVAAGTFTIAEPLAADRTFELAPDSSRTITIRFAPETGAVECSVLTVSSNDEERPSLKALFTGQGNAPRLCTDRASIDFGEVEVGQSRDDVLVVRSCGTHPITLQTLTTNGSFPPFSHDAVTLPVTLEVDATLEIPVHFTPPDPGLWTLESGREGALTFTAASGEVYEFTLEGRGRTPPTCDIDVTPTSVNFGSVADDNARTRDVLITNRGGADCTIIDAVIDPTGVFSAQFLGTFTAGSTLAPNDYAYVRVTTTRGMDLGRMNATLTITSDDPVTPTVNVPLEVTYSDAMPCTLTFDPMVLNFGVVPVNTVRTSTITVTNVGTEICVIRGTAIEPGSDPGFAAGSSGTTIIPDGEARNLTVSFRPASSGTFQGHLRVTASDTIFAGTTVDLLVELNGRSGAPGICVTPRHLDYGAVNATTTMDFTISACGASAVTVEQLEWTVPDAEFTIDNAPMVPFTLMPGGLVTVTTRYTPADAQGDTAVLSVHSDDPATPVVPVDLTGGPETVPPAAGRYLYYWQIPNMFSGDVMKFPLQGNPTPEPFYGPRTGRTCAGCHSVSPDGLYVAVLELAQVKFVEADTGYVLNLPHDYAEPQYFSWRPDVNTNPPYQFAYGTANVIKIAALFDGFMRDLAGATTPGYQHTMPTWGPGGKIAFVRGAPNGSNSQGATGFNGPTDIMLVDENGGTAEMLAGASENTMANYYPQYSPDGRWIAFTQSASAVTTVAATDSKIRLVRADGSGTVLALDTLNGVDGANSYPTWARDGSFLSFSSNRTGGAGSWDIYVAPLDPMTGVDGPARNITELNSAGFEHAAQWSP